MEKLITTDAFEAYTTDSGIKIVERSNAARKLGFIVITMGVAFIAISYIPLRGTTADIIVDMFENVFFWGGVILLPAGILTLVLKGYSSKERFTELNNASNAMITRSKSIPFAEIDEFKAETHQVMGKSMTMMFYIQNGKKKPLVPGTFFIENDAELQDFVSKLNDFTRTEK